ncbi:HAUS augmin-like complex subunit 6 isoform X2 [Poecile atricapillus]|uniref:HAUS augmin-like complex subunit 6 isoform X2 n=1 Tax=Poecile atricapillus TaxID=48891 RepID=UPI00273840D3|nr:HAUS augmin-like complex subunit 6 isoform X2 [Poecile atricapillus]
MADKWESDHLWLCLLALGLRPKRHCGVKLGRNMFAKPNSRAFHVVALFLFTKLDKRRARQTFKTSEFRKHGSPKFRKHCCLWLREISQKEVGIPRITPSMLLCPGGAKFVHVIYLFARYIMIENMKKLSVGTGIPFAEAVRWRPDDMYIAEARHRVAYNKLLQNLRREDFVIKEYREKAQVLIREIKRTVSEYEVVQKQSFRMKQNNQNKNDTTDKIQKVRSMWTLIVEILTSLKKEKEVVDSVLQDCANPCVLDGTDVVVRVPGLLTYRVESNIHEFCTGNLYEDGKLNFLTVIQLLNEALMTLRDEPCPCEFKELHRIEDMVTSYKNALQELKTKSRRRRQQHCEPKQGSISRKQEIWESKWKTILGQCPFNLIFKDDPQLASLQSLSSSDEDEDTVLCQSFSDNNDSHQEECHGKNDGALETMMDTALVPSRCDFIQHEGLSASEATDSHFLSPFLRRLSVPLLSEASNNGDLSIENNLHTCVGDKKLVPPKIFRNGQKEFPTSAMEENADENVTQPKSPVKKDSLEKARDELAEEIVKAVMSESTDSGEEGMALDDVFSSLSFNTFLMRKQITQTPENLLTEIRSSWRRAIQTEGSLDLELSSAEVVTEESSMNATHSMQEEVDSSFVCSEPASPVSDLGLSVSEKKSQLSSTESSFQEQVSHTFGSSDSKTSGIQESERTESEELGCSALSGSSVEDLSQTFQNAEKSMNIPRTCLKSDSRTNTGPSDHCSSFLMDETLRWNISALNTVGDETTDMGILDETLPEIDSIDLSMSPGLESVFNTIDSENLMDGSKNEDIEILDLDIQSPPNSHEVLKKTASKSEEELHQKHDGDESWSNRPRLNMISEGGEDDDPSMDEGFTTMPLPNSPNESKYSLSSLLVSGQQDGTGGPTNLLHKLKDKNS